MTATSEYLYRLRPARPGMLAEGPTAEETKTLEAHVAYLRNLVERHVVVLAGRTTNNDETTFGLVIFRAGSDGEAEAIMAADPAVREGAMTAELFPYRIAMMPPG